MTNHLANAANEDDASKSWSEEFGEALTVAALRPLHRQKTLCIQQLGEAMDKDARSCIRLASICSHSHPNASTRSVTLFKHKARWLCNRFVQKNRTLHLHNGRGAVELLSPPLE